MKALIYHIVKLRFCMEILIILDSNLEQKKDGVLLGQVTFNSDPLQYASLKNILSYNGLLPLLD